MNSPHISLVRQYLADPESVSVDLLRANSIAAYITALKDESAVTEAAASAAASAAKTAYWLNRYEELTGE